MIAAFFGDAHGSISLIFEKAAAWEARTGITLEYLFQVGDFGIWPNSESVDPASRRHAEKGGLSVCGDYRDYAVGNKVAPRPIYFIRGNHEDQLFLMNHERIQMALYPEDYWSRTIEISPNFFYIPDGHVVDIGGVRFAAWGGNFAYLTWKNRMKYWDSRRQGRRLNHMTVDVYERLLEGGYEVLLTHDAPLGSGVVGAMGVELPEDEMTGGGCQPIRTLIDVVRPRFALSGHWHEYHKNVFGDTTHFVLDKTDPHKPDAYCMEVLDL